MNSKQIFFANIRKEYETQLKPVQLEEPKEKRHRKSSKEEAANDNV